MTIKHRPDSLAPQTRTVNFRQVTTGEQASAQVDLTARTVELAFASETAVDMWYGTEILSMAPGAMRTGVRQATMPLLFNHALGDLLGVVEDITIGLDRVARARVRFGKDERGEWAMQQCADGVLVNVSFLYRVFKWIEDTEAETITATDWEAYEVSLVTVPADPSVGVGRNAQADAQNGVQLITSAAAASTPPAPESASRGAAPGVSTAPVAQTRSSTETESENPMFKKRHLLRDQATDGTTGSAGGAAGGTGAPSLPAEPRADNTRTADPALAERTRITEIEAMCKKYGLTEELRRGMITKGATIEQARMTCADVVMERAQRTATPSADMGDTHNPDMSEREKARYSMLRAVNAAVGRNWKEAGFELECSNEISKRLGRAPQNEHGFFMPTNIQFGARATYTVGTPGAGTAGGTTVATNLLAGSFIEVLRNRARVLQLGATVLSGLVGSVDIPRQTGQSSTYWVTEGNNVTQSEATFDKVSLAMKTIGTYSQVTRNMLMQSTPDIDMIARGDLIAAMALGIDLAALSGSGSGGQPLGIGNVSGIGSVIGGTNGAQVTLDHLIDLETQVTAANVPEESLAYMVNAKTTGWLKKQKSTTGQYLWTNNPNGRRDGTPGEANGYPVARSNQARSTLTKGSASGVCSEIFFGAWPELLIGEWGVLEIVPNPYDAAVYKNGGVLLRALQSIDIGLRHNASFATMSDALTV